MKTGTTTRDVEHFNPRCNARGTIKAGTTVRLVAGVGWVVAHRRDAEFMSPTDFRHSYVEVPADAVEESNVHLIERVDPEVQADRDEAIELARELTPEAIAAMPTFNAADELTTMEGVLAFVREIQDDDEPATIVSILEIAHTAAARIMEEQLRQGE